MPNQRSLLNAIKWSYSATWGERAIAALFTLLLAAFLGPKDFGILSISLTYVAFIQMFLDQGLVAALIQKKTLNADHLDAVFWTNLAASVLLIGVSGLFGRWWSGLNHAPEVATVIPLLSLCIPIEALATVQKARFSREMDFRSLSIRSNVSVLVGGLVGSAMAWVGSGVWALVGQRLSQDFLSLVLLWRLSPWRPRLRFSIRHLRELMSFSISHFVAQLANFADTQTGSILLGLFFGPSVVGLYRLAERLANTVLATATGSIQWVSLPAFSRSQDNPNELRQSVLTCLRLSSTITLPALAGLAAVSEPLMAILGPKWLLASSVLKILCAAGMCLMFALFTGPLLQALSKVKFVAIIEWIRTLAGITILSGVAFLVREQSIRSQVIGIAYARLMLAACLVTPFFLLILLRTAKISFRAFVSSVAPSVLSSVCVLIGVRIFHEFDAFLSSSPSVILATDVLIGSFLGLFVLFLLDGRLRSNILTLVKKEIRITAPVN